MIETCINIAFAISIVCNILKNPEYKNVSTVNQILKYLAGSKDQGIIFEREANLRFVYYFDSN